MTLRTHQRLIEGGFVLAYAAAMGALAAPSFGHHGAVAIKFFLLPLGIIGCCIIAIAKLGHVRGD